METEALDLCPWLCRAPQGPNTPFAWPAYFVIDCLRIYVVLAGLALIVLSILAICRSQVHGQKARFAFAAALCIAAAGTEIERLGDQPHWRFLVNLVGVTLGLWGYYQHLFHEVPARDLPPRQDPSP